MDDLLDAISKEQQNRFNKPWNKLDKGLKLNRINEYVENYDCDDNDKIKLKDLLIKSFNNNTLKNDHIKYNLDNISIININTLTYENNTFSINNIVKKTKPKIRSKTKTNIERHFNRSKKSDAKTI